MTDQTNTLWDSLNLEGLIIARHIVQDTRTAGKPVRQGVAWVHNALYSAILKKEGSVEHFIEHVNRRAGVNKEAADNVKMQLEECAIISDVLQADARAARKAGSVRAMIMQSADKLAHWCIDENNNIQLSYTLLLFLRTAVSAVYDEPENLGDAVINDQTLEAAFRERLYGAVSMMEALDNYCA